MYMYHLLRTCTKWDVPKQLVVKSAKLVVKSSKLVVKSAKLVV